MKNVFKIALIVGGIYEILVGAAETLVANPTAADAGALGSLATAPSVGSLLPCCAGLADLGVGIASLVWGLS
jgi:hypothetical protein